MSKPIVVIKMPQYASNNDINSLAEQFRLGTIQQDYHIIMFGTKLNDIDVQVYYEKDFNKVKFEELKDIIEKSVNHESESTEAK